MSVVARVEHIRTTLGLPTPEQGGIRAIILAAASMMGIEVSDVMTMPDTPPPPREVS